jgi:hypothetical protein
VDDLARGEIFELNGVEVCRTSAWGFMEADEASAGGEAAVSEGVRLVAAIRIEEDGGLGAAVTAGRSTMAAEEVRLGMACLRSAETIEAPEMRRSRTAATVHSSFCRRGRFHQARLGRLVALELERKGAASAFRAKG